jgi:hypothetical protein
MEDSQILIPNVTKQQIDKLREVFTKQGGSVDGDDKGGVVENECFEAGYEFDEKAGVLTVAPIRLVDTLSPRRLRRIVKDMLAPPREPLVLPSGQEILQPTPRVCAVYNWAIGFFTNNSGLTLRYSKKDTFNGNLSVSENGAVIPNGTKPGDLKDGFWVNQGTKDAVTGCFGWIEYVLDDGFTIRINYGINTLSNVSLDVGVEGPNTKKYKVTWDAQTLYSGANVAAYLYPYVTIATA